MKCFLKEFCKRGLIAFGFGPIIMAIVYLALSWAGVNDTLSFAELAKQILLVSVMAFLASGVSAVYQIEKLPLPLATFIQAAVLYVDYIGVYFINGWLKNAFVPIMIFTAIFLAGFVIVWIIVYFINKYNAQKLNESLKSK